jgi:TraM recognition site of TraD and TraG
MNLDELVERRDIEGTILATLVGLAIRYEEDCKAGQTASLDAVLQAHLVDKPDIRELAEIANTHTERYVHQMRRETFCTPIESDQDTLKALFWVIERWQFITDSRSPQVLQSQYSARSWEYFRLIVVPAVPGFYNSFGKDGRVSHVFDTRPKDMTLYEKAQHSSYEKALYKEQSKERMIPLTVEHEQMKALGYPYTESYDEYLRFIKNNFIAMRFKSFNITLANFLSILIPHPVDRAFLRRGHTYIVGRSGSGKSELLKGICKRLDLGYVLLDPHGDLADELGDHDWGEVMPNRIAPHERRFVINPFDIADKSQDNRELVAQEITDLISELVADSGLSRLMTTIIFPIVYTLLKLPYADFKMLTDCINPNAGKTRLRSIRSLVEPHHLAIWHELEADTYDTSKQSVFNRLQSLLNYRLVMQTLCGRDDFAGELEKRLDNGEGAIVSLPIPVIGEAVAVTLGRFFMTRMQIWAKRRQSVLKKDRTPICLIVDEFHNFMSHSTAETLDQYGRKFGLFMILAHQHIQQITDREIRGSVLANTINKISGMSNAETRQAISKEMGIDADSLENLRVGNFWGRFGSEEPFRFYARMVKLKHGKGFTYLQSVNGTELIDGWDGFDQEEEPQNDAPGTKAPKLPKKGAKPKFEI